MQTFSNILVAYDGSPSSMKAVKMGLELKKQSHAGLTILHVLEETTGYIPVQGTRPDTVPASGMGSVDGLNIYTHNAKDNLHKEQKVPVHNETTEESLNEVHALLAQERVDAAVEVLHGDPAKTICNFAEEHANDLVVIGSRGLGGLKKLILGSVSDKVANTANCPVLVAK